MLRIVNHLVVGVALCGALAAGCDDGGDDEVTAPPPTGVPAQATPVTGAVSIGEVGGDGDEHVFESATCANDVLVIATSRETVYAGLPCDRTLPDDVTSEFEGVAVAISVAPGPPMKVYLSLESGESVEFTVEGVWVVPDGS